VWQRKLPCAKTGGGEIRNVVRALLRVSGTEEREREERMGAVDEYPVFWRRCGGRER
jgi:hypothetical protein